MPCNSDHMAPNAWEEESHLVCQLIVYVGDSLMRAVSQGTRKGAASIYGGDVKYLDEQTSWLCSVLTNMTPEQRDRIIYDGRNPNARKLADWWDRHQNADKAKVARVAREMEEERLSLLRATGLSKLTEDERKALDLE